MAKKVNVDNSAEEFEIDMSEVHNVVETPRVAVLPEEEKPQKTLRVANRHYNNDTLINCLRKEIITVKHVPQPGAISDPRHVLSGGMAERSFTIITVPRLRSGAFKNVLTDSEKDYLEYILGLESGALNVYNKTDNFWSNTTEGGISKVRLTKEDTRLDLSDPVDYIKYKILLANKDLIAPDILTLLDKPKATYKYVLISDSSTNSLAKSRLAIKKQGYMELGKIEDKPEILKTVIEIITSKPVAKNTKLDFLQTRAGELLEQDPKIFVSVVKDPLLAAKVLIQRCVEESLISKRGDYYYLRSDGSPLCENGEEPILTVAAKFLTNPKRLELKLSLETKLNYK